VNPTLDRVLERFNARQNGTGFKAKCPAHDDRTPSLSIAEGDGGVVLVRCFAGCETVDVLARVDLTLADLYPPKDKPTTATAFTAYDYRDEEGRLLSQTVRRQDGAKKTFYQRQPKPGGGWSNTLKGVRLVLYRLPDLMAADLNKWVLYCEGEQDCDRAASLGWTATTTPMGAGKWRDEYAAHFAGRAVAVIADNDEAGEKHAAEVAASLAPVAAVVAVVSFTDLPPKGDLSDWLDAGGSTADLERALDGVDVPGLLVQTPEEFVAAAVTFGGETSKGANGGHTLNVGPLGPLRPSLAPLGVKLSEVEPERIDWLSHGRLAVGKMSIFDGDPGLGKSTVALDWAARLTRGLPLPDGAPSRPRGVVILSAEDGVADTLRPRAEAAGADLGRILVITALADGGLPTIPFDLPSIEVAIASVDAALLIVDPLVAFLGDTTNANRDQDVRRALAPLKLTAERTGTAVALIRHLNKMVGANALYRGGGSIGLIGAARFGLLFARDPDDPETCFIAPTKSNLSRPAPTLTYRLLPVAGTDVARVEWTGESLRTAAELLAVPEDDADRGALGEAREFLADLLREGSHPSKVVRGAARDAGVADRTLRRAKQDLGVVSVKSGVGRDGFWEWSLPKGANEPPKGAKGAKVSNIGKMDTLGADATDDASVMEPSSLADAFFVDPGEAGDDRFTR